MKRVYQIGIALLLILSLVSGVAFAEGTKFFDKETNATFVCGSDWEQHEITKDLAREGISGVFVHKDAHTLFYVSEDKWDNFEDERFYSGRSDINNSIFDPVAIGKNDLGAEFEQLYAAGNHVWMKYSASIGPDLTAEYYVLIEDAYWFQFMFYTSPSLKRDLTEIVPEILRSFDINGQLAKSTTTTAVKSITTTTPATSIYLAPLASDKTSEFSDLAIDNENFDFWALLTPLNLMIATVVLWVIRVLWGMYLGRFWDDSPEEVIRGAVQVYKDSGWELPRRLILCLGLIVIAAKWLSWLVWVPFVYLCIVAVIGTIGAISVIIANLKNGDMRLNMNKLALGSEVFHILSLLQVYMLLLYMIKEIWL